MTDRLPPHNYDAEDAVLASILVDDSTIHDVAFLEPEHFYKTQNQQIFRRLRQMVKDAVPLDFVTLGEHFNNEQYTFLVGLSLETPNAYRIRHYADIVFKSAMRRQLITAAGQVATYAWDDDADLDSVIDSAQSAILDAIDGGTQLEASAARDGLARLYDETAKRYAAGGALPGITTGFLDMDALLEGLEPGNVYILAGRPGMGKSALEGCIRLNVSRAGKSVLSFNLEMPELQSWQRLIAVDTGLEFKKIRKGAMSPGEWQTFGDALGRLSDLPMWINDSPAMKPSQMHSEARRHQAVHGLDLVTVDYLQLMASNHRYGNRVSEVGDISRGLKQLALSLDVPVLVLAQLSRACEQRADKRPMLSDLRDSGDIEQDADVVMFIYRDDYYYGDESEKPNQTEVIVAKHRNGPLGTVDLFFDKQRIRFKDLARKVHELPNLSQGVKE